MAYVLTDDQQRLLRRLASAYSTRDEGGARVPVMLLAAMVEGPSLQHYGLPDGSIGVDIGDLEELAAKGLVAFLERRNMYDGQLRVTAEGERHAQVLEQLRRGLPRNTPRISLAWEDTLPVLQAALDTWEKAGAPELGVSKRDGIELAGS